MYIYITICSYLVLKQGNNVVLEMVLYMKSLICILLHYCITHLDCFVLRPFRTLKRSHQYNSKPDWMNRPEEAVIIMPDTGNLNIPGDMSLFDTLYNADVMNDNSGHSISDMTVRSISEAYQFSLPFLGDFMIQLGCQPPLDIDTKISNLLTGGQIFSLLNALNTLDAYESNAGYDSMSLSELAESLGISKQKILRISKKEELNLPFGMETVLHVSIIEKIKKSVAYDEYTDDEDGVMGVVDIDITSGGYKNRRSEEEESDEIVDFFSIGGA